MIQYTWEILSMKTENNQYFNNLVIKINYKRTGIDGDLKHSIENEYYCQFPAKKDFIDYDKLTFEQVCNWLEDGIRIELLDNPIKIEIEKQKNVILENNKLPWQDNK
jgi:hypothetical protein